MHTEHTIYNAPFTLYTVQKDAHNIHGARAHNHRARTMNWVVGGSLDDEQGAQNVHRAHKQHTTYTLHSAQNQDNTHDIHSVESHRARTMYRALEMETLGPTQCLPPCLCT